MALGFYLCSFCMQYIPGCQQVFYLFPNTALGCVWAVFGAVVGLKSQCRKHKSWAPRMVCLGLLSSLCKGTTGVCQNLSDSFETLPARLWQRLMKTSCPSLAPSPLCWQSAKQVCIDDFEDLQQDSAPQPSLPQPGTTSTSFPFLFAPPDDSSLV